MLQSSISPADIVGFKYRGQGHCAIRRGPLADALPILLMNDALAREGSTRLSLILRETHNHALRLVEQLESWQMGGEGN